KDFQSFANFKDKVKQAALTRFGSGWAWVVVQDGKLTVKSSPNQNTPLSDGQLPILGIDVWEHAYYLKYQNKRTDYVDSWGNVVNRAKVGGRYNMARKQA